jgi:O-antigen/teichoic acid export membrane protein
MTASAQEPRTGRWAALKRRYEPQLDTLRGSDTAKAGGLAGAMIANNVLALISTVVFARLLTDYGSLAALISYFLILSVAGQALQIATAREGVLGHLGVGPGLIATLRRWTRSMLVFTAVVTVLSVALQSPIASLVGVHQTWATAIGLPAGCLWLEVSILRGALQGVGDYKSVGLSLIGEQAVRLIAGAALAGIGLAIAGDGLGITGAYLGTPLSFIAVGAYCAIHLRRYAAAHPPAAGADAAPSVAAFSLWTHVKRAWAPIVGLIIIAVLQNIDIIAAKHRFDSHTATSYAAVAVAAKVLIWIAIGAGFYLVPEVSRRQSEGEDTRPVLLRTLGIIIVAAIPCLLIFALGSHVLIKTVFGASKASASDSLLPLGAAFAVLACTYLAVQYMLALKRTWFLVAIGAVAVAEPVLLLQAPRNPASFAVVVLGIQAVGAVLMFALALRRGNAPPAPPAEAISRSNTPTQASPAGVGSR